VQSIFNHFPAKMLVEIHWLKVNKMHFALGCNHFFALCAHLKQKYCKMFSAKLVAGRQKYGQK
jgi:hypothetical protein